MFKIIVDIAIIVL